MNSHKVLIMKTRYPQILDEGNNSRAASLGDIFRTTPLLHLYKNNHVTWATNLKSHINWINSYKMFVNNDTLGLHLALALKKDVLGLFGPTPHREFCFYGGCNAILPEKSLECIHCFKSKCSEYKTSCVDLIYLEKVFKETKK